MNKEMNKIDRNPLTDKELESIKQLSEEDRDKVIKLTMSCFNDGLLIGTVSTEKYLSKKYRGLILFRTFCAAIVGSMCIAVTVQMMPTHPFFALILGAGFVTLVYYGIDQLANLLKPKQETKKVDEATKRDNDYF